ncbi:pilus assembly protein [Noviherbaspirillum pedocola]|uniref:Pilus assembly protein PilY n=1 Tax=Noviherbaspirillum pedocola TaxID=2801341 RepID=A0A934SSL5_9BURK|nr:PilC/PilY family type IV pilus protein [Noviherbaspirillum pedocola]MBK4736006.1 pilus assembly protein PilY [Noviherbaspirillum pedocola]
MGKPTSLTAKLGSTWGIVRRHPARAIAALLAPAGTAALIALGAPTPPAIPPVNLSSTPLFAKGQQVKPTVTLALSVEFPTVGLEYLGTPNSTLDDGYAPANEYFGYYDADSCYSYLNDPSPDKRRFVRMGAATNHTCGGIGFSGNFMNWASSSGIDLLRLGLSGGDRIVDTSSLTVLQRAVLPTWFFNSAWAPAKKLSASLATGAVPNNLLQGFTGDVYVSNCLNRIHFGTDINSTNCFTPAQNSNLGTAVGEGSAYGPLTSYSGNLPADLQGPCGGEGSTCNFMGTMQVFYGSDTRWNVLSAVNGVECNNFVMGDPAWGAAKYCYLRPDPSGWQPPVFSPVTLYNGALPSDFQYCSDQYSNCNYSGAMQVAFGSGNNWVFTSAVNSLPCTYRLLGDPAPGASKSCYVRPDPTGWSPNTPTALTSDAFFYSRMQVCDSNASGALTDPRTSYCDRYPSGYYKPIGALQRYSDKVRVAAFGYLMDNQIPRYGGVLRAPMTYVGPTAYDSYGNPIAGLNPKSEWDPATGIFTVNPEGAAENLSGVINYLNQFGRTGPCDSCYKMFDPITELYYEAVRYLQGLQPTPAATDGMTDWMKAGFPVYTSWTDPHADGSNTADYSCVRNSIITVGDDNTHDDKSIPGNTSWLNESEFARPANPSGNEPDFHFWTQVVGGFESNNAVSYPDNNGTIQTTVNPGPYINGGLWGMENQEVPKWVATTETTAGYFMAGIAYWANTHDIRGSQWSQTDKQRPGMRITSYFLDANEYNAQSDPNSRHNNQQFLAAKYGGFIDQSGIGNPFYSSNGTADNSPWMSPYAAGEARTYFLASGGRRVVTSIDQIFNAIIVQANSIAGGAITGQRLTSGGAIYEAQFDSTSWSGDVIAFPVTVNGDNTVTVSGLAGAQWTAATQLDAADFTTRKIAVGKVASGSSPAATDFSWGNIESTLADQLNRPSPTASPDGLGQQRLNFLRGDRSLESTQFRKRASRLGDILNSGVVYEGAPSTAIGAADYLAFYNANANRTPAVYVGANDGMLHAFNAATGAELFGYIPSWMGPNLSALTSQQYTSGNHQSYVDATPVTGEALVGSNWKTVLVGGTGAGGQGVYALDVTDPTAFDSTHVLWEFTDRDDADIGNIVGRPQILKVRVSAPGATPQYKWFAVVASGVDNYVNDGNFSATGNPALFLLDLSKPASSSWALGSNYYKVSLPVDPTLATSLATGAINFTADGGAAGEVAHLYIGDLHGRMWKLNFTRVGASGFTMNTLTAFSTAYDGSGNPTGTPLPLYIAQDNSAQSAVQPITAAPALLVGPNRSTIVAFGTGKYLEDSDNSLSPTPQQQTVYALYDDGSTTADSLSGPAIISGRKRLAQASISGTAVTIPAFTWGRAMSDTDTLRSGWFLDFTQAGERQVSDLRTGGGDVLFASAVPPGAQGDVCGRGSGNIYDINLATNSGTAFRSHVGMPTTPFMPEAGPTTTTVSDSTGRRMTVGTRQVIVQGASGVQTAQTRTFQYPTGRLSWRQINNYRALRNQ